MKINGINEQSDLISYEDPLKAISKYLTSELIFGNSNVKNKNTSEAFSGGGAWDVDDERPELYEKDSSLHQISNLLESSDKNLDEMLILAFGNSTFISADYGSEKVELPSNYIPKKVIGNVNIEIPRIKQSNCNEKNEKLTYEPIADIDEKTASAALKGFMPFDEDLEKQTRYIKYLRFCNDKIGKATVPKSELYLDENEREEFIMSAQIYKPTASIISSRFESSSTSFQPLIQLKAGLSRPDIQKKSAPSKEVDPPKKNYNSKFN